MTPEDHLWLAHLARTMVRDAHEAEDLVQDSIVIQLAAERPEHPRAFLKGVLRNRLKSLRRGTARRRDREVLAFGGDRSALPADVVAARSETQALVRDALHGLKEPVRDAMIAHYLEGESSADLARRLAVPAATIRGRLSRGRHALRARLDGEFAGEAGGALSVLLLLAGHSTDLAPPAAAAGTNASVSAAKGLTSTPARSLVSARALAVAGTILAGCIVAAVVPWWKTPGRDTPPAAGVELATVSETARGAPAPVLPFDDPTARTEGTASRPPTPSAVTSASEPPELDLTVRVVARESGLAVPDAEVTILGANGRPSWTATRSGGVADLVLSPSDFHGHGYVGREDCAGLRARAPGFRTSLIHSLDQAAITGSSWANGTLTIELVAGEATVTGRAIDGSGQAVANARVVLRQNAPISKARESEGWTLIDGSVETVTDDDGAFSLSAASTGAHSVYVQAPSYLVTSAPVMVREGVSDPVELTLSEGTWLRGRVEGYSDPARIRVWYDPPNARSVPAHERMPHYQPSLRGFSQSVMVDASGEFALGPIPVESYPAVDTVHADLRTIPLRFWAQDLDRTERVSSITLTPSPSEDLAWTVNLETRRALTIQITQAAGIERELDEAVVVLSTHPLGEEPWVRAIQVSDLDSVTLFDYPDMTLAGRLLSGRSSGRTLAVIDAFEPEESPVEVAVPPRETGTVSGSVTTPDGRLPRGTFISFGDQQRGGSQTVTLSPKSGSYQLDLMSGSYAMRVHVPGKGIEDCGTVEVTSGHWTQRDTELAPTGRLVPQGEPPTDLVDPRFTITAYHGVGTEHASQEVIYDEISPPSAPLDVLQGTYIYMTRSDGFHLWGCSTPVESGRTFPFGMGIEAPPFVPIEVTLEGQRLPKGASVILQQTRKSQNYSQKELERLELRPEDLVEGDFWTPTLYDGGWELEVTLPGGEPQTMPFELNAIGTLSVIRFDVSRD